MLMSSRRDPPKHLVLPKQTSRHLTISNFLLHSPLPSPALPSILPRHGKKPPKLNTQRFLRYLCWIGLATVLFVIVRQSCRTTDQLGDLVYEAANGRQYEIVGTADLPDYASPVAVSDRSGKAKWTVSIPAGLSHPLAPTVYADICANAYDVAQHVADTKHDHNRARGFNDKDSNYVDITEAHSVGLLPHKPLSVSHNLPYCKRSLTYVLDASEAGLGQAMLGLWMSYSLAKLENRALFIDDTNFPYGSFTDVFSEVAETPDCQPPPWEHRTPCPHQANHLIVNGATLRYTFGKSFQDKYNTKEIYRMAREGYEALFKLRADDAAYVAARTSQLRSSSSDNGKLIGIHIRRGDRHPFEFQYQHGYIPPSKYMTVAHEPTQGSTDSVFILASDDADLYQHPGVNGTIRAQEQIRLASRKQLAQGGLGWEGGFFSDAFWNIGVPEHSLKQKYAGSPQPTLGRRDATESSQQPSVSHKDMGRDYRSDPTPDARQMREYIGRAYLLDLAVLAHSDEIVCGVSSYGCRILGVMMGWDKLHGGKWKNVDGDYGWRGLFSS